MTDPRELLDAYGREETRHDWITPDREDQAPKAFAALRAVLDLHSPMLASAPWCMACTGDDIESWPCPTVQNIIRELEGK